MTDDLQVLTAADFTPYLQQQLTIRFAPGLSLPAELIEVKETENYSPADRKPFFIVLRTDQKDQYYQQGVYSVEHPQRGELAIFLVPLGPDGKGMRYEAIFS